MLLLLRRLLVTGLFAVLVVTGAEVPATAAGVRQVSGVKITGQDWCAAKLRVRWDAVRGATYQVRSAPSRAGLRKARPVAVRRNRAAVGPLSLIGKSYLQIRAVKKGRVGSWSSVREGRFARNPLAKPELGGTGVAGGSLFAWGCTLNASRYRLHWAAAPHGLWPIGTSAWMSQGTRSSVYGVAATPAAGDAMLPVAYANPVWARLEAGNAFGGTRLSEGWTPVFPAPPGPGTGDPLRIGTYNVMMQPRPGARVNAIAANISQHGLSVVTLQEADTTTAAAVVSALGPSWAYAPSGAGLSRQILYRKDQYGIARTAGYGSFQVLNPREPGVPLVMPWARLEPLVSAQPGHGGTLFVASVHFTQNPNKSEMEKKRDNGLSAQDVMNGVAAASQAGDRVIVAGDLFNVREPFGDVAGYVEAQPTFVRGGYYDAMAALQKTNIQFSTVNGGDGQTAPRQAAAGSGVSSRMDYLMLKGFRSSNAYVNVANWSWGGLTPSDHNLVYADLTVPFTP